MLGLERASLPWCTELLAFLMAWASSSTSRWYSSGSSTSASRKQDRVARDDHVGAVEPLALRVAIGAVVGAHAQLRREARELALPVADQARGADDQGRGQERVARCARAPGARWSAASCRGPCRRRGCRPRRACAGAAARRRPRADRAAASARTGRRAGSMGVGLRQARARVARALRRRHGRSSLAIARLHVRPAECPLRA